MRPCTVGTALTGQRPEVRPPCYVCDRCRVGALGLRRVLDLGSGVIEGLARRTHDVSPALRIPDHRRSATHPRGRLSRDLLGAVPDAAPRGAAPFALCTFRQGCGCSWAHDQERGGSRHSHDHEPRPFPKSPPAARPVLLTCSVSRLLTTPKSDRGCARPACTPVRLASSRPPACRKRGTTTWTRLGAALAPNRGECGARQARSLRDGRSEAGARPRWRSHAPRGDHQTTLFAAISDPEHGDQP